MRVNALHRDTHPGCLRFSVGWLCWRAEIRSNHAAVSSGEGTMCLKVDEHGNVVVPAVAWMFECDRCDKETHGASLCPSCQEKAVRPRRIVALQEMPEEEDGEE